MSKQLELIKDIESFFIENLTWDISPDMVILRSKISYLRGYLEGTEPIDPQESTRKEEE